MDFLSRIGAETKALSKTISRDIFGRGQNNFNYSVSNASLDANGWPQINTAQGSANLDFDKLMGDPLRNGVVAACVSAIVKASRAAPLLLEQRTKDGWQIVPEHECLEPLYKPNDDHSSADIWGLTSGYKATRGQAFWLVLPDTGGRAREIYVWHPDRVEIIGSENEFISKYRLRRETGQVITPDFPKEQIIHFRDLPDFENPRLGWNSLSTSRAHIAGDNLASTYSASILFNAGVVSLLISLRETTGATNVTPEQFKAVLEHIRKANRERAGGVEGINLPLQVDKLAYSPDEMSIDKLIETYERRVCTGMGVSQRVCGLGADPTYNNLGEALNDFWERRIVPDKDLDADALTRQWLPLWGMDATQWRFRFDYSNVPALQENKDEFHKRIREDYKAGAFDLKQYRVLVGYASDKEADEARYADVFYAPPKSGAVGGDTNDMENQNETKAIVTQVDVSKPQKLEPWTDEELDAMTTFTEEDLKQTLANATPEARKLLTAKQEKK